MQFAEIRRWQDFRKPGSQGEQYFLGLETVLKGSGDPSYPGQYSLATPSTLECRHQASAQAPCMPADDWQSMQRRHWAVWECIAWQESAMVACSLTVYPPAGGQFFNLFNLGRNDMKTLKTKELKNGRLAMVRRPSPFHCRPRVIQNAGWSFT